MCMLFLLFCATARVVSSKFPPEVPALVDEWVDEFCAAGPAEFTIANQQKEYVNEFCGLFPPNPDGTPKYDYDQVRHYSVVCLVLRL